MANSRQYIGIDLTDAHSRGRRAVDLAVLHPQGQFTFSVAEWPEGDIDPASVAQMLTGTDWDHSQTVFVIDGPQGLATPQENCRKAERRLGAPARTPWRLPQPGDRPFAGYIRTSIEFFSVLTALEPSVSLAELNNRDASDGRLFEAYPGAAWRCLRQGLDSKSTKAGRAQRTEILRKILQHLHVDVPAGLSHDELDAALCAALGLLFLERSDSCVPITLVGEPVRLDEHGNLREGRILMPTKPVLPPLPKASPATSGPPKEPPRRRAIAAAAPLPPAPEGIDPCKWVYFAAPAGADAEGTYELAAQSGIIARKTYNIAGALIANVQHLEIGDTILLVYSNHGVCRPLGIVRVTAPDNAAEVPETHVMMRVEDEITCQRLDALDYPRDPYLQGHPHTVIPIELMSDLQDLGVTFQRPVGNNALWSWRRVFGD